MIEPEFIQHGVRIFLSRYVEKNTYVIIGDVCYFRDQADVDKLVRRANQRYRLRRQTKAMRGNARRRDLLALVQTKTFRYWIDEMANFTDEQWAAATAETKGTPDEDL